MDLVVSKECLWGGACLPHLQKAKLFANISGNKTLLPEVIELIKKLGYSLTTESEKI